MSEQVLEIPNIEALISKISFEIVNEKILDENEINKLLGVLSNNGVYAMWVYALDKIGIKYSENKEDLREKRIFKLLDKIAQLDKFISKTLNFNQLIEEIANFTQEINSLQKEIKKLDKEIKSLRNGSDRDNINEKKEEKKLKLKEKENKEKDRNEKLNSFFQNIAQDIHQLLFLKQLLEKTLIYARYHAKAIGGD